MKLRLIIDVEIDPNGVAKTELVDNLHQIAKHAASEGMFTGCSDAEVVVWSAEVVNS